MQIFKMKANDCWTCCPAMVLFKNAQCIQLINYDHAICKRIAIIYLYYFIAKHTVHYRYVNIITVYAQISVYVILKLENAHK